MALAYRAMCVLLVSLAVLQCVQGEVTAPQVVQALEALTTSSAKLRAEAVKINYENAAFYGIKLVQGFLDIGLSIQQKVGSWSAESPARFSGADTQLIVKALRAFSKEQQSLLHVVIDKRGLKTLGPYVLPIYTSLVSLDVALEVLKHDLERRLSETDAAIQEFNSLLKTVHSASETYEPISMPWAL